MKRPCTIGARHPRYGGRGSRRYIHGYSILQGVVYECDVVKIGITPRIARTAQPLPAAPQGATQGRGYAGGGTPPCVRRLRRPPGLLSLSPQRGRPRAAVPPVAGDPRRPPRSPWTRNTDERTGRRHHAARKEGSRRRLRLPVPRTRPPGGRARPPGIRPRVRRTTRVALAPRRARGARAARWPPGPTAGRGSWARRPPFTPLLYVRAGKDGVRMRAAPRRGGLRRRLAPKRSPGQPGRFTRRFSAASRTYYHMAQSAEFLTQSRSA